MTPPGSLSAAEQPTRKAWFWQQADTVRHKPLLSPGTFQDSTAHRIDLQELSTSPANTPGPSRHYTFVRKHKRGGLGSVWVVHDERAGRDVALKKLRRDLHDHAYSRQLFENEARVTAQLQHPNIVPVYDLGHDDQGEPYYTMRLVAGRTLSEQIDAYTDNRSSPTLSGVNLRRLLDVFRGVCNAVHYAHSKNIVHLDLKPSNVIVGEFGEVILLDWGCAKHPGEPGIDDGLAATTTTPGAGEPLDCFKFVGTPAYMAPEQIQGRGDDIGSATDIYQLGAILYEILTSQPPHAAERISTVLRRVRQSGVEVGWAEKVKLSNPAVPALAAICGRALARNPSERYASVNELLNDVERWMADEPVSVYHAGFISRLIRWVRRHQTLTSVAVAGLGLLVLFNGQLLRLTVQERCVRLASVLVGEMKASVGAVDGLQVLFETRPDNVSREEFDRFVRAHLENYPQISAVEWIPVVRNAERAAYEDAVRESTWPSAEVASHFQFTENAANAGLVRASQRDVYFPVYYVAPYEGNETAFGYDLGSSPDRLATLREASRSNSLALSAPMELVQESPRFLVTSRVAHDSDTARDYPRGYVLGVFKAQRILTHAWRDIDLTQFSIRVYDVTDAPAIHRIWSNVADPDQMAGPGLWGAQDTISLWNREWLITLRPKLSFVTLYPFSSLTKASEPF